MPIFLYLNSKVFRVSQKRNDFTSLAEYGILRKKEHEPGGSQGADQDSEKKTNHPYSPKVT